MAARHTLTHIQFAISPNAQISFRRAALQPLIPQSVYITRSTVSQVQNPALAFVKFHMEKEAMGL